MGDIEPSEIGLVLYNFIVKIVYLTMCILVGLAELIQDAHILLNMVAHPTVPTLYDETQWIVVKSLLIPLANATTSFSYDPHSNNETLLTAKDVVVFSRYSEGLSIGEIQVYGYSESIILISFIRQGRTTAGR